MSTTVADLPGTWSYLYKPSMKLRRRNGIDECNLTFLTTFGNLSAFVVAITGTSQTQTATWGTFSRVVSLQHPLFPGLYAVEIECEAFGTASQTSTALADLWSHVKVSVLFRTALFPTAGDQAYMSFQETKGATYTTIPGRKFAFPSGEPIDQEAGAFSVTKNYILTLYQCPTLNSAATDALVSKVNDADFFSWPAGHLLFGGCESIEEKSTSGVSRFQRSYTFAYRSHPWNQAYQKDGVLDTPEDPAGNPEYETGNFFTMLQ